MKGRGGRAEAEKEGGTAQRTGEGFVYVYKWQRVEKGVGGGGRTGPHHTGRYRSQGSSVEVGRAQHAPKRQGCVGELIVHMQVCTGCGNSNVLNQRGRSERHHMPPVFFSR